jgi:AGCS family alanine or glycine:cation symporter
MTLGYVAVSLAAIYVARDGLGAVISSVIESAFTPASAAGGVFGFFINRGVRYGVMRGLLSNEAGCGTSPFAHSSSDASLPARQGVMGIAEVFVDTVVLCTMTGLVVLLGYGSASSYGENPMMMTLKAYSAILGGWSEYFMCAAVLLFGFATVICWGYYGEECVYFLNRSTAAKRAYYAMYVALVFFGSFMTLDAVWEIADFAVGGMTVMNLYILGKMSREIAAETRGYFGR